MRREWRKQNWASQTRSTMSTMNTHQSGGPVSETTSMYATPTTTTDDNDRGDTAAVVENPAVVANDAAAAAADGRILLVAMIVVTVITYCITLGLLVGMVTFLDYDPFGAVNDGAKSHSVIFVGIGDIVDPSMKTPGDEREPYPASGGVDNIDSDNWEPPVITGQSPPKPVPEVDDLYQKLITTCGIHFRPPKNPPLLTPEETCREMEPLEASALLPPKLTQHLASSQHPVLYELLIAPSSARSPQQAQTAQYRNNYYEGQLNLTVYIHQPTRHIGLHMNTRFVKGFVEEAGDHRMRTDKMPPVFIVNRCYPSEPVRCPTVVKEYTAESMILLTFDKPLDAGEYYVLMIGSFFGEILCAKEHADWLQGDHVSDEFRGGLFGDYEIDKPVVLRMRTVFPMRRARTVFPCMDQPDRRARFQLRLRHSVDENAYAAAGASDDVDEIKSTPFGKDFLHLQETTFPVTTVSIAPYQFGFFTKDAANLLPIIKNYAIPKGGGKLIVEIHMQEPDNVFEMVTNRLGTFDEKYVTGILDKLLKDGKPLTTDFKIELKKLIVLFADPVGKMGVESCGIITLSKELMSDRKKEFGVLISTETFARNIIGQLMNGIFALVSWEDICLQEGYRTVFTDLRLTELGYMKASDVRSKMNHFRWESLKLLDSSLIRPFESLVHAETICEHKAALVFAMIQLVHMDVVPSLLRHFVGLQTQRKQPSPILIGLSAWSDAVRSVTVDENAGKLLETYFTQPGYPIVSAYYPKDEDHGSAKTVKMNVTQYSFSKYVLQGRNQRQHYLQPAPNPTGLQRQQNDEINDQYFAVPIRLITHPVDQKSHWFFMQKNQKTVNLFINAADIPDQKAEMKGLSGAFTSIFEKYLTRVQIDNSSAALVLSRNLYTADNYVDMMFCWKKALDPRFSLYDKRLPCLTDSAVKYWVRQQNDG